MPNGIYRIKVSQTYLINLEEKTSLTASSFVVAGVGNPSYKNSIHYHYVKKKLF